MNSIWIVIVNYRTADLVVDCLRSLSLQIGEFNKIRIEVVDNDSGDDSVLKIASAIQQENWSAWADVIPLAKNGGFAFGNNSSIKNALASTEIFDYVMLLNPDTVALPRAIKTLVDFMDAHPQAGIAGSQLKNADGSVESSAHTFPTPLSELEGGARLGLLSRLLHRYAVTPASQAVIHQCDWVSGASMIIRRQVIEDIGLMDEGYFLYFEEVDYCYRARRAGWQCWHVPSSSVLHLEGSSTGIRVASKRRAAYWFDSRRRLFYKCYGIAGLIAADVLWTIGRLSYLLRRSLRLGGGKNEQNIPDWFMFDLLWGDLKAILTGRLWRITHDGKPA